MPQPASVTGQTLTSGRTTFTIADSAKAKASGGVWELPNESGGFHIWPVGEQEGEHAQESAEESPNIEAFVGQSYCAFARKVVGTSANRISPLPAAAMWSRDREREHCPRPL